MLFNPRTPPVPIAILSATPLLVPSPKENSFGLAGGSAAVAVITTVEPSDRVKVILVPTAILAASVTVIVAEPLAPFSSKVLVVLFCTMYRFPLSSVIPVSIPIPPTSVIRTTSSSEKPCEAAVITTGLAWVAAVIVLGSLYDSPESTWKASLTSVNILVCNLSINLRSTLLIRRFTTTYNIFSPLFSGITATDSNSPSVSCRCHPRISGFCPER